MLQGLAGTIALDPVYAPIAIIAAASLLIVALTRSAVRSHQSADPLAGLFEPEILEIEIEATERRKATKSARSAVLRGRIDHLDQVASLWGPEARADAIKQVAQVMRAGVRRGDTVSTGEGTENDGEFAIVAEGADEQEASAIAKRLLQDIGSARVAGMSKNMRLSASIGVAARRYSESERAWNARAREALNCAQSSGEDQVVTAGDWEEIMLLEGPATDTRGDAKAA